MTDNKDIAFDKASNTGWRHVVNATRFSAQGLKAVWIHESAFRWELGLTIAMLPPGVWIAESLADFLLLMAVNMMVLVVELLNSAIEATLDRIGTEHDVLAGRAKDYGSAAVMISLFVAGMVWLASLLDKLGLFSAGMNGS